MTRFKKTQERTGDARCPVGTSAATAYSSHASIPPFDQTAFDGVVGMHAGLVTADAVHDARQILTQESVLVGASPAVQNRMLEESLQMRRSLSSRMTAEHLGQVNDLLEAYYRRVLVALTDGSHGVQKMKMPKGKSSGSEVGAYVRPGYPDAVFEGALETYLHERFQGSPFLKQLEDAARSVFYEDHDPRFVWHMVPPEELTTMFRFAGSKLDSRGMQRC